MRMLILAAFAAIVAAPAYAAVMNGNTGEIYQPGEKTPPASGATGNAGAGGDVSTPSEAPVGAGGGQAGLRSQGSTPDTNRRQ